MKTNIGIAVIGVGSRGSFLANTLREMEDVRLAAVCDLYEDRRKAFEGIDQYEDYRELLCRDDIDGVIIATSWDSHAAIAIDCMKNGKIPAVECGGADSMNECWQLVRTSEAAGIPCMFLENCCYGRNELSLLRMVNRGDFGEIVHVQGGYEHDIRSLVAGAVPNRQARFETYLYRCADFYPTHELGPIMKYLNINYGNRLVSLTSMASKARGMEAYNGMAAKQGDIVNTLIKCAHGETILLTYDTTLPRPYSRGGRVQGTKGLWMEDNDSIYIEGKSPEHTWEPFSAYLDNPEYEHPLWKKFRADGVKGGHGGMDYLVLRAFIESIANESQPPLDVYDTALLMSITLLSEESIAMGGKPVPIPDFTDGKWIKRKDSNNTQYKLSY